MSDGVLMDYWYGKKTENLLRQNLSKFNDRRIRRNTSTRGEGVKTREENKTSPNLPVV